jgi:hypothetical protein
LGHAGVRTSEKLLILVGPDEIDFEIFRAGFGHIEAYNSIGPSNIFQAHQLDAISACMLQSVGTLETLRERYLCVDQEGYMPLWELITESHEREATNPLDKIYALLSFVGPVDVSVKVDYSKSPAEVFTELALAFMDLPSVGLDCLCLAGTGVLGEYSIPNLLS